MRQTGLSVGRPVLCLRQTGRKDRVLIGSGPSTLSLLAAAGYGAVVLACLFAAMSAKADRPDKAHGIGWVVMAAFFALLLVARLLMLEEILRDDLREWLRANGDYEGRQAIQLPIASAVMIAGLGLLAWLFKSWRNSHGRRERALVAAQVGVAVMIGVILLRTISFSVIDKLLYGPLKLNWVGDIGASLIVFGAALYYARMARLALR